MDLPRKILERITFIFVFALVAYGVFLSRTNLSQYEGFLVKEDGLIEYLTVVALFLGFVMSLYRVSILKPFRNTLFIVGLYVTAFVFLFGLGEEISWGQRIIGFKSPDFFLQFNTQGELNLHNLRFGNFKINRYIFGTFLGLCVVFYFLILPSLYNKIEKVKKFCNSIALPVPRIYHVLAYVLLFGLVQLIDGGKKGEILEFGGCWIVLLMLFEPKNRELFSRKTFDR